MSLLYLQWCHKSNISNADYTTSLLICRCSWGMWWCNRKAAAPWSTVDIWSREGQVWGNTPGSWVTRVPGCSREDCPQEGGAIMGHRHRYVRVHSRLQHRQISCALLWSKTRCLLLSQAGLTVGKSHGCGHKYLLSGCAELFVCGMCRMESSMSRCRNRCANKQKE